MLGVTGTFYKGEWITGPVWSRIGLILWPHLQHQKHIKNILLIWKRFLSIEPELKFVTEYHHILTRIAWEIQI